MNENQSHFDFSKKQKTIKRLADDLAEIDTKTSSSLIVDYEMLSLIIDDALKGVDISVRYPTFYRKLLNNADLRQAFVDALEAIEKDKQNVPVVLPLGAEPVLDFLSSQSLRPTVVKSEKNKWHIIWQQTIEQLQSIFSPPELAYRSDPSQFEDPWLTLLRGETDVAGSLYTVLLECSLAKGTEESITLFLNIAVTFETTTSLPQIPIYATLQWGSYTETLAITEEGRIKFPNISLSAILDEQRRNVKAELSLTLETTS